MLVIMTEIGQAQYFKGFAVELVFFFFGKQQYTLPSHKLYMQDMTQVDIEMHVGDAGGAAHE